MNTYKTPTLSDLRFGKIAAEIYSHHRVQIMRNEPTETFSVKIACALKEFRCTERARKQIDKRAKQKNTNQSVKTFDPQWEIEDPNYLDKLNTGK